jgi:hypothetical protein
MMNPSLKKYLVWLLKGNLIIWALNVLLFAVLGLSGYGLSDMAFSSYFSKITLAETGVAFIVGGAFAFSGSVLTSKTKEHLLKSDEQWSIEKLKSSEKKANKYILLAAVLFAESLLISLFGL